MRLALAFAMTTLLTIAARADVDLSTRYAATLEPAADTPGYDWTCTDADVWKLQSFAYQYADRLDLRLGPCEVVFGVSQKNVVWAALFPREPGAIHSALAGDGEQVATAWMRFHPARLRELFPPESVAGPGDADRLIDARRLAAWKMNGCFQVNNRPAIPPREGLVFDIDTPAGKRRFFTFDFQKTKTINYIAAFEARALPAAAPIDAGAARKAFDTTWDSIDREYPMFALRKGLDWNKLREQFAPRAAAARDEYRLALALDELLANLEDLHVHVIHKEREWLPGFQRPRPLNASWSAIQHRLGKLNRAASDVNWAKTTDGIGYLNVGALSSPAQADTFDAVLDQLGDTWALILDLRFNGGGDEEVARRMAGRFLERTVTYSMNQYRNGPRHDDLGEKLKRTAAPCGPWRYRAPTIVLTGQKTMSSAESFVLMLAAAPRVTTMGDRTAGSSGNPRRMNVSPNVEIVYSRWLDLDPDGKAIDGAGIEPTIAIKAAPSEFTDTADPVLDAALENLRQRPADARQPGRSKE